VVRQSPLIPHGKPLPRWIITVLTPRNIPAQTNRWMGCGTGEATKWKTRVI
jgi:hypothetical protein